MAEDSRLMQAKSNRDLTDELIKILDDSKNDKFLVDEDSIKNVPLSVNYSFKILRNGIWHLVTVGRL